MTTPAPVIQNPVLTHLQTPSLVLDAARMDRNIARLRDHLAPFDVVLRPHLKTTKSIDVARHLMDSPQGPATVSTLKEAARFAEAGVRNIIYAVGITPDKLKAVDALRRQGVDLAVVLDSPEQAEFLASHARDTGIAVPALIEIDCDGHRSGVRPDAAARLIAIGEILSAKGALRGVLTHAGGSYGARGPEALRACAQAERDGVVLAAQTLRDAGFTCPVVSMGSTPTVHHVQDLSGVTEVRAGVFVFHDLVMVGIGVCDVDDIALSVLTTVIGHQREKGWVLIDAGWMAMSRDRGTARQDVDQGYGLVCDVTGRLLADIVMVDANQEHGIIAVRPGSNAVLPDLQIGDRLRILPNHACATGAHHDRYHVVRGPGDRIEAEWPRFGGW